MNLLVQREDRFTRTYEKKKPTKYLHTRTIVSATTRAPRISTIAAPALLSPTLSTPSLPCSLIILLVCMTSVHG